MQIFNANPDCNVIQNITGVNKQGFSINIQTIFSVSMAVYCYFFCLYIYVCRSFLVCVSFALGIYFCPNVSDGTTQQGILTLCGSNRDRFAFDTKYFTTTSEFRDFMLRMTVDVFMDMRNEMVHADIYLSGMVRY